MADILQILRNPQLLASGVAERRHFDSGQAIIVEGSDDRSVYLIEQGVARVSERVELEDRRHIQPGLCDLAAGEVFGELSLFESGPRSASVVALEPCELLVFDAEALAGWWFDVNALDDPANRTWLETAFLAADVEVFASSHACLPACRRFEFGDRAGWVINNGSAGMANFADTRFGVVTRIGVAPSPHSRLYGGTLGGVHIDALALEFDADRWEREFLANWPPESPAHVSYFARIRHGPAHEPASAAPRAS